METAPKPAKLVIADKASEVTLGAAALAALMAPMPSRIKLSVLPSQYESIIKKAGELQAKPPNGAQNSRPQNYLCVSCNCEIGPGRAGRKCKPCREGVKPAGQEPVKIMVSSEQSPVRAA